MARSKVSHSSPSRLRRAARTGSWLPGAVIYHVLVDRFAGFKPAAAANWDYPDFVGGTLDGIRRKLDYLQGLGVNALWLSPIFKGLAYHGYHITDFRAVDPRFGTLRAFRSLVKSCHERDIRVILDFVPNHCHQSHPFFQEAKGNPKSKFRSWFRFSQDRWQSFLGLSELPKLNLENKAARSYMIEVALFWQKLGIDGLRIDHAIGVSHGFLKALSRALKQRAPDFAVFGEVVVDQHSLRRFRRDFFINDLNRRLRRPLSLHSLQKDYRGVIDGTLDFHFFRLLMKLVQGANPRRLSREMDRHFRDYPPGFTQALFASNHDDGRFFCQCLKYCNMKGRAAAVDLCKLALSMLFECARRHRHAVVIYYGDEILLNQVVPKPEGYPYSDIVARRVMSWKTPNAEQADFKRFLVNAIARFKSDFAVAPKEP